MRWNTRVLDSRERVARRFLLATKESVILIEVSCAISLESARRGTFNEFQTLILINHVRGLEKERSRRWWNGRVYWDVAPNWIQRIRRFGQYNVQKASHRTASNRNPKDNNSDSINHIRCHKTGQFTTVLAINTFKYLYNDIVRM